MAKEGLIFLGQFTENVSEILSCYFHSIFINACKTCLGVEMGISCKRIYFSPIEWVTITQDPPHKNRPNPKWSTFNFKGSSKPFFFGTLWNKNPRLKKAQKYKEFNSKSKYICFLSLLHPSEYFFEIYTFWTSTSKFKVCNILLFPS
jgi:hypothetical protein